MYCTGKIPKIANLHQSSAISQYFASSPCYDAFQNLKRFLLRIILFGHLNTFLFMLACHAVPSNFVKKWYFQYVEVDSLRTWKFINK